MALKNAFQASLTVVDSAGNVKQLGEWDAFTGGKFSQSETKYTPANRKQRTYVGLRTIENVTLERDYEPEVDGPLVNISQDIRGMAATIVVEDRDPDGNFQRNREPYVGKVLEIIPPDGDTNDASAIVKIGIVVSVENPTAEP